MPSKKKPQDPTTQTATQTTNAQTTTTQTGANNTASQTTANKIPAKKPAAKETATKKTTTHATAALPIAIALPKSLQHAQCVDLTRHRYQGKLLTQADSIALGKQQRKAYPLKTLAAISQRPTAIDALSLYHWSNQGRLTALLPIRAKRMSVSPFTFFRGMPALMLFDQAWQGQHSGLFQQICGDCHVSNFGGYASPERNLLFGINDFDETIVAPFEWDLQRLVASILIASQSFKYVESVGYKAIEKLLTSYLDGLEAHCSLSPLQVWYEKIDTHKILANTEDVTVRKRRHADFEKAKKNDAVKMLPKLTERDTVTGLRAFKTDGELQRPPRRGQPFFAGSHAFFDAYRDTLKSDRQVLFDRYDFTDVALKVVGVGSVGTVCAVALFQDADHEPLILQMKQAKASILTPLLAKQFSHQGKRVVEGQQLMQASSDIFLGYASLDNFEMDFYVRQLRDMKYSASLETMTAAHFYEYIESCGHALAHAHTKVGNADTLMGYLGNGSEIISVMQAYAEQTAARNAQDYVQFMNQIADGHIAVAGDEVL